MADHNIYLPWLSPWCKYSTNIFELQEIYGSDEQRSGNSIPFDLPRVFVNKELKGALGSFLGGAFLFVFKHIYYTCKHKLYMGRH